MVEEGLVVVEVEVGVETGDVDVVVPAGATPPLPAFDTGDEPGAVDVVAVDAGLAVLSVIANVGLALPESPITRGQR